MSHPWAHAKITAEKYGGQPGDHLPIHSWFDDSKSGYANNRHRAARHHSEGVFWCEEHFGETITVTRDDGSEKKVPTRLIAEDHVLQDLGTIPSMKDWLQHIDSQRWMRLGPPPDAPDAREHDTEEPVETFFNVTDGGAHSVKCTPSEAEEAGFLSVEEMAKRFDQHRARNPMEEYGGSPLPSKEGGTKPAKPQSRPTATTTPDPPTSGTAESSS
jgi:hypothetical protein